MSLVNKKFCRQRCRIYLCTKRKVFDEGRRVNAIPYDLPGAEYSHYGDKCTFDYILKKHKLDDDTALKQIATIVRGADTNRFNIAPQAAGLWAISAGLSHNYQNDHEQLAIGLKIYDALYSWAKYVQTEIHTWNPQL